MQFPDRRRHPRVHLITPVEITDGRQIYQGLIRNISLSGLGLESYDYLPVGKAFTFSFYPGGFLKLKIDGVIRWYSEFENKKIYGVEFVNVGLYNRFRLSRLIKKLAGKE